jgi:hypothetical protein
VLSFNSFCGAQPWLAILALLLSAADLSAQVVRGRVVERLSGIPLAGVLVTLDRLGGDTLQPNRSAAASALSDRNGEFALLVSQPGRYILDAKRIGVQRYQSEPFQLSEGEARQLLIELDALLYRLPEVVVEGTALCALRPPQARRVAALWEEARTALAAARISARDRLARVQVTRYSLNIDPENVASYLEGRGELTELIERPFTSLAAESLSAAGYWRDLPGDSAEYYGPDAEVLLSEAFQRDHCYGVVEGGRGREGLIGLAFEPRAGRRPPEVRGTLWLDERSFELRYVEFTYDRLPYGEFSRQVGGEVHFERLSSGAWFVRRWFIRSPQYRRDTSVPDAFRAAFDSLATIYRLLEDGGSARVEGVRSEPRQGRVRGTVLDSAGAALAGAVVRLAGTDLGTTVDNRGRFQLDSVPPGSYSVVVQQDGYALLGVLAGHAFVTVGRGSDVQLTLRAPRGRQLMSHLCEGRPPGSRQGVLRVLIVDSASAGPLLAVPLRAAWSEPQQGQTYWRERQLRKLTGPDGSAVFCALPPAAPVEIQIERPDSPPLRAGVVRLRPNEIAVHVVYIAGRRPAPDLGEQWR